MQVGTIAKQRSRGLNRLALTLGVAMGLALPLAFQPATPKVEAAQVTIKVVSVTDPGENEIRKEIVALFEKRHPNIKVQLLPVSDRVTEQLVKIAGGDPPDVLYLNPSFFGNFVRQGLLEDLMPYVKRDGFKIDQLYSTFVDQLGSSGHLYAMPFELTSMAMLYNQTAFDNAGLPNPPSQWKSDKWTWQTMVQHGRKLTKDTNGDGQADKWGLGLILGAMDQIVYPWVFMNGGKVFDDKTNTFQLNSASSAEALQFLADLINKEKIARGPVWGVDPFLNETVAMYPFGRWLKAFQTAKFQWNAAPLPMGHQAATMLVWLAYGITSNSKHKNEAWEFLKFLVSPEVQALNTVRGQALSVLPALEEHPQLQGAPPKGHYGVFAQGIRYAQPVPYADNDAQISQAIWSALDPVWKGTRTAKQAMDSIVSRVESLLKKSTLNLVAPTRK